MLVKELDQMLSQRYQILCLEDLGALSQKLENLFLLFQKLHKSSFDPHQRLVLYSKETVPFALIQHIQKIADLVDISNNFILIVAPGNNTEEFEKAKQSSTNDTPLQYLDVCVDDGSKLASPENYTLPETMCVMPWINVAIGGDGTMAPCCAYASPKPGDEGYTNISTHSLQDYYHSKHTQQLRQDLLSGKKPSSCSACWNNEAYNTTSIRQYASSYYIKEFYAGGTAADLKQVVNLDLDLGNLCNLKCRICNWRRSSLIATEVLTKGSKFVQVSKERIKNFNKQTSWVKDPDVLDKLSTILPNLRSIESEGGEPFLHDFHTTWYQKLIELDNAGNVKWRHSTNATVFPDHTLWPRFKEVQINLSIDDIADRFEYQRDGAVWSEVTKVFDCYHGLDYGNLKINFWIVISLMNVLYLPEIVKTLQKYGWGFQFSVLAVPEALSLQNMTQLAKTTILEKYKKVQSQDPEIFKKIEFLIEPIEKVKPNDGLLFWDYVDHYDQKRNKYFHVSHPEMSGLMGRN